MHLNKTSSVLYSIKMPSMSRRIKIAWALLILICIMGELLIRPFADRFIANWATTDDLKGTIYYTFEDFGFGVNRKDVTYVQSLLNAPKRLLDARTLNTIHLDIKF